MFERIKNFKNIKKFSKSRHYSRLRQYFPQSELFYLNDQDYIEQWDVENVLIDWPEGLNKPHFGIVRDYGKRPRWTKYLRFLKNNKFSYDLYNIHASDWIEQGKKFDVIAGVPSSVAFSLEEIRRKYHFLERYMGKLCYPKTDHIFLYEDKRLEAYLSEYYHFRFAKTYTSNDKAEALQLIEELKYPLISKIDPSSGSMGVEMIPNLKRCKRFIQEVFSNNGRKTHLVYFRQKNYVYFQEFIPNDGFDIRVILVGNKAFGYYRKTPEGDFRASGMNIVEKRSLPLEAIKIAFRMNKVIQSPQLVVDMVHGLDGQYHIIEYSPFCQMETPQQLMVDDEPGVYIIDEDETIHFEKGQYWVPELALKAFLKMEILSSILQSKVIIY